MTPTPTAPAPRVVLVTGASSGIGAATALRLGADGHRVVLAARRTERLRDLAEQVERAGGTAGSAALDVTDAGAVRDVVDGVVAEHGRLDVMVNNAGVMPLSRMDALLVDQRRRMVDVNVHGLLHGIAAALPHFLRQASGHVVTMASVVAHRVSPTAAVYCGTKHATWAITEGLRQELDPGIRVTTISPVVVESELADSITDPFARDLMRDYRRAALPAAAVAAAVSYAIAQPAGVDVSEIVVQPTAQR